MKAALIATNAASMVRLFNENNIQLLLDAGYEVHIACNFEKNNTFPQEEVDKCKADWESRGLVLHQFATNRSPLSLDNLKAFFDLRKILSKKHFDLVHCHAPISSVICRLAAKKHRRKGTKVMYTAHGFHFFKGAPLLNWLVYFPIEWFCSFFTDILITINKEDFAFAKKHMHAKNTEYIPGVGVDTVSLKNITINREEKREELGIPLDSIAVLSVGELNANKNHEVVLRAIAKLDRKDIVYVICGIGKKEAFLIDLAKELGLDNRLILLGYRTDIAEINKCCDIFAFPSLREGLPVSLLEAVSVGLPAVVSKTRGNRDIIDGKNGFLCKADCPNEFADAILRLAESPDLRREISLTAMSTAAKFDISNINSLMPSFYTGANIETNVADTALV
ncbi:MAG: glycosyltransferase family 4 protein [Ruminococcaceae bacterium]|nr:glycosyltransferase family 4 protein [Oscillospiraceae bacterium]